MRDDMRLDYIELPAPDIAAAKRFYGNAFGWAFTDYGPAYAAFHGTGIEGGFDARGTIASRPDNTHRQAAHGAFVIFKTHDLEAAAARIEEAGGRITTPPFDFPGGRRFHFTDPAGNELGVWAEPAPAA